MARPPDPRARVELLRAAEAVFIEHGLEAARVEEITRRAGRSKGSFYLHFDSKEDAFRQIVEALLVRLTALLDEEERRTAHLPVDEASLGEWLQSDLRLYEYLWENRGVARLLFRGESSARFSYLADEFADRARARTQAAIERRVRTGAYRRDLDVAVVAIALSGAYDRLAREVIKSKERPDLQRWLSSVQRIFQAGLAAAPARPGEAAAGARKASRPSRSAKHDPPVKNVKRGRPSPARSARK